MCICNDAISTRICTRCEKPCCSKCGDYALGESIDDPNWPVHVNNPACVLRTPKQQNYEYILVIDFEADSGHKMAKVDGAIPEIIEFPCVVIDTEKGRIVGEFRRFVRPVLHPHLSDFIRQFCGIEQEQVDKAKTWPDVMTEFTEWVGELGLLGDGGALTPNAILMSCGNSDFTSMLKAQNRASKRTGHVFAPGELRRGRQPVFSRWINIKTPFRDFLGLPVVHGASMATMLDMLDIEIQGRHHSGIADARNLARIALHMMERGVVFERTN